MNKRLTDEQLNNSKPWLFKKGESGNPQGRPKGTFSIKTMIVEHLEKHPEELDEMIGYLIKNEQALIFQMIDGRPKHQQVENVSTFLPQPIINIVNYEATEKSGEAEAGVVNKMLE